MRVFTVLALIASLFATPAFAFDVQMPDPAFSARQVVSLQLEALKNNDEPRKDAGIKQTYALAHPQNKMMTGPLPKFTQMIESPTYRMMLNHQAHMIEEVAQGNDRAVFGVTIVDAGGEVYKFRWTVRRIEAGEYAGAWATTAVSPPQTADDSI